MKCVSEDAVCLGSTRDWILVTTMARGNDGNLLQHTVESELAAALVAPDPARGLWLTCTHAMAPFEPIRHRDEEIDDRQNRFSYWWKMALRDENGGAPPSQPAVLGAYRRCRKEDPSQYPNSAEVVSALVGRERVAGVLIELDGAKHRALAKRWCGTNIKAVNASWRKSLAELGRPAGLDCPWLFTMDPMQFVAGNDNDDAMLHPGDFGRLLDPVRSFLISGQPGVFCVFCYSMWNHVAAAFKMAVEDFREKLVVPDLHVAFAEIRFGGISHVGAMLSRDQRLLDGARDRWISIRDGDLEAPSPSGGD